MRRLLLGLVLVLLLAPATAQADRTAAEGVSAKAHAARMVSAQHQLDLRQFAQDWWAARGQQTTCAVVKTRWISAARMHYATGGSLNTLAFVPDRRCLMVFNAGVQWDRLAGIGMADEWWRFCAVGLHEFGHLPGMPFDGHHGPIHSRNPDSVMAGSEQLNTQAWWWPYFPGCRYEGDDQDRDGLPDL